VAVAQVHNRQDKYALDLNSADKNHMSISFEYIMLWNFKW